MSSLFDVDCFNPKFADRFWSKVDRNRPGGCWEWTRSTVPSGYGQVYLGKKNNKPIHSRCHRTAWELVNGPIPNGLCVLHACDNRLCVNPEHLWLGTIGDNTRDMCRKGRAVRVVFRGGSHGMAKLTAKQVRNIRSSYANGRVTQTELAARYGVSNQLISTIVTWKTWKHLKP